MTTIDTRTNDNDLTFNQWMAQANRYCIDTCMLGVDDLPDGNSYDAWNDGLDPEEYVDELLEAEGFDGE